MAAVPNPGGGGIPAAGATLLHPDPRAAALQSAAGIPPPPGVPGLRATPPRAFTVRRVAAWIPDSPGGASGLPRVVFPRNNPLGERPEVAKQVLAKAHVLW